MGSSKRNTFEDPELEKDVLQPLLLLRVSFLPADREPSLLDERHVLLGGKDVPPSATVAVRVRPGPLPEIRLPLPVAQVVPTLELSAQAKFDTS